MRKYWKVVLSAVILTCFVSASAVIASSANENISNLFDQIKTKITDEENVQNSVAIATGDSFKIEAGEFKLYKANLQFIAKMNNVDFNFTNEEILKMMAKDRLIVQYAKDNGISVTNQEVDSYIKQTRNGLQSDEAPAEFKEIMKNRIRISGLTEEQFYNSPEIRQSYERLLYGNKVAKMLSSQGRLTNPLQDYEKFKEELWNKSKDKIKINRNALNKI
jgi:hypothetical protein